MLSYKEALGVGSVVMFLGEGVSSCLAGEFLCCLGSSPVAGLGKRSSHLFGQMDLALGSVPRQRENTDFLGPCWLLAGC